MTIAMLLTMAEDGLSNRLRLQYGNLEDIRDYLASQARLLEARAKSVDTCQLSETGDEDVTQSVSLTDSIGINQ